MTELVKFTFGTSFAPEDIAAEEEAVRRSEEAPSFTEEDMAAARAQAHGEGVSTGIAQARGEIEQTLSNTLTAIREQIETLASTNARAMTEIRQEATALAHVIAAKLAPALIAREPLVEVEALITECLATLRDEPRIVVRANERVVNGLKDRLNTISAQCGYPGQIVMLPDDNLSGADCRVEWADGGAERDQEQMDAQVGKAIRQFVNRRRTAEVPASPAEPAAEQDAHAIGEPHG